MAADLVQHESLRGEREAEELHDLEVGARHAAAQRGGEDEVRDVRGLPSPVADGSPSCLRPEPGYALVGEPLTEVEGRGLVGRDGRAAPEQVGRHAAVPLLHHGLLS